MFSRLRKKKFLSGGLVVLMLVVVSFLFFWSFEHYRGEIALANYKKKLIEMGEKISPEDYALVPNTPENGGPALLAAHGKLRKGSALPDNPPPTMQAVQSGNAVVGCREKSWIGHSGSIQNGEWVNQKTTNDWSQVESDLRTNQTVLVEICEALSKPTFNNQMNVTAGTKMTFTHLAQIKRCGQWLGFAGKLALRQKRFHDAAGYFEKEIQLPKVLADDRVNISELVRSTIASVSFSDTWEALQHEGWTDADLVEIQRAWESQHFDESLVHGLEGERVFEISFAEQVKTSNDEAYNFLFVPNLLTADESGPQTMLNKAEERYPFLKTALDGYRKHVMCRIWRFAWASHEQLHNLKEIEELINACRSGISNKRSEPKVLLPEEGRLV